MLPTSGLLQDSFSAIPDLLCVQLTADRPTIPFRKRFNHETALFIVGAVKSSVKTTPVFGSGDPRRGYQKRAFSWTQYLLAGYGREKRCVFAEDHR